MRSISTSIVLVLLSFFGSTSIASSEIQTDWSGGPGTWGPVTAWSDVFSSCFDVNWFDYDGMLELAWLPLDAPIAQWLTGFYSGGNALHCGDVDGDGDLDVLSVNGSAVHWWSNAGGGTVWNMNVIDQDLFEVMAVYSGHIDDDSNLDVVGSDHGSIRWYENHGTGSAWTEHFVDSTFHYASSICMADLDNDLDQDVIAAQYDGGDISWWENVDYGTSWSRRYVVGPPYDHVTSIHASDLDGDGDLDLLVTYQDRGVYWYENLDGSGNTWQNRLICYYFAGAWSVFSGDMDGDGDEDVVGAAMFDDRVTWWENLDGSGTSWQEHSIEDEFIGAVSVCSGDLDEDGHSDVIAAGSGENCVAWWENEEGTGNSWIRHDVDPYFQEAAIVALGDFNGDCHTDIIGMASGSSAPHSIIWWMVMGYANTAMLTSSVLDVQESPEWGYLDWSKIVPYGTKVEFQVRASTDPGNMGAWSNSLVAPDSLCGILADGDSLFQYRAIMSTTDPCLTPTLQEVEVSWEQYSGGIENDDRLSLKPASLLGAYPNPSRGAPVLSFTVPEPSTVSIAVYDLAGREAFRTEGFFQSGTHQIQLSGLGCGVFLARMESGRFIDSNRFVVID